MMNRNRIWRQIRRRKRQRMLEKLRRQRLQAMDSKKKAVALEEINRDGTAIFDRFIKILLMALAVVIGIWIWIWAAGRRAENEAQAAVLRAHRITSESIYSLGPGVMPGENQNRPIMVESLPETPPEDGEPPEAIEIRTATMAEAVPDNVQESEEDARWESLGRWKLTAYCPLECCNGKGRAWKTASGKAMEIGRTVAVGGLPFGTILMINGNEYEVTDRGVHGQHVDILHESHKAANRFGVQYAEVFIKR